jgi:hypothetical protein
MDDAPTTIEEERGMQLQVARNAAEGDADESDEEDLAVPSAPAQRRGPRISIVEVVFMVLTSLIFDGIQTGVQLIPAAGIVLSVAVSIVAWLTFFIWFHAKGMTYGASLKRGLSPAKNPMVINIAAGLIGFTPLAILPERTFGIILIIAFEYLDYSKRQTGTRIAVLHR